MTIPASRSRIIAAAIAVLIVAGLWWWSSRPANNAGPLVLQGNVEVRQVNLGFKVAGRIKSLDVDEGTPVVGGQRLASLDKIYFHDSLDQARAQRDQVAANLAKMEAGNRPEEIAQAEAQVAERDAALANAKIAFERAESLLKTSAGTRKAYDDAQAAYRQADATLNSARQALLLMKAGFRKEDIDVARAQLAASKVSVEMAERALADADLVAPNPGVVLSRVREAGAIVNAGETVLVLSLVTPVWIRTYVSELDLSRIRPDMKVQIKSDSPGSKVIDGRVGFISPTAEFTPKTVETRELRTSLVYRVRIVAEDPDGLLRQGQPLTVIASPVEPSNRQAGTTQ